MKKSASGGLLLRKTRMQFFSGILILNCAVTSPALSQSFEQFERAGQFERAMVAVERIKSRSRYQCLVSTGNPSLCECFSKRLPFDLHIRNYASIASQDKAAFDYEQLSSPDKLSVEQCIALSTAGRPH